MSHDSSSTDDSSLVSVPDPNRVCHQHVNEAEMNEYKQKLQGLQRIRDLCQGQLNLPQMCVVGDQSAGKSSLLELLTGIKFPVKVRARRFQREESAGRY